MSAIRWTILILSLNVALLACGVKKTVINDSSKTSLDWSGVYHFYDSEDNQHPEMQITINEDGKFSMVYGGLKDAESHINGSFTWDKAGRIIELDKTIPYASKYFLVGENVLYMLNEKDSPISDSRKFNKVQIDSNLVEKYWKLVSINDRKVTREDFTTREPHMIFKSQLSKVNGNDGCNGFGGSFKLNGNEIVFSQMISTMMACPDSFVFNQFMKILTEKLTYKATENTLEIKSKNNVLKFEVVYL